MRLRLLVPALAPLIALAAVAAPSASAAPTYAPAATAAVHPGVQTLTEGAQCTSNFVFTDGARTFLGQAAHCSGLGAATDTDGCLAKSLPLGTKVDVDGATQPGTLVYSSWLAMQTAGEKDADTCAYNDFALVELAAADVARTNPSVPVFGGPTALGAGTSAGDSVYSYGNSSLRQGLTQLSPKVGASLGDSAGGWTTSVYTLTPGIPGDSGSGFLDATGRAFGTLSTVALAPLPLSNGVGNLAKEVAYAQTHGVAGLSLVKGDVPFTGSPLSLLGGLGGTGGLGL
ncbi:MAG: hypothetical protein JWM64_382 [Frankiales bacterium]|nr:hypothetical protein [Frankiales bacterium]